MQVARLVLLPRINHLLAIGHHDLAVFGYAIPVKSRLSQPSLAQPEVAFARQEPVAEDGSKEWKAKIYGLDEKPVVRHKDLLYVFRVVEHIDGHMKKPEAHHISVSAGRIHQKVERVRDILGQVPAYEVAARAVRMWRGGHYSIYLFIVTVEILLEINPGFNIISTLGTGVKKK
jgi:hypothetical protein